MKRVEYVAVALIVVLAMLSVALGSRVVWAQSPIPTPTASAPGERTVTVTGEGQAEARPDRATVIMGVQTDADTAAAALSGNNQQMQGVLDAVRQAGIPDQAVQTQQVQLSPRYSNPQQGGTPQLVGYTALNTVQVRVDDLTKLGGLLDASVKAGGNRIEGIQFVVSDMGPVQAQARMEAWNDAVAKAQQLAQLAGAQLGQVLNINETTQAPRPFFAAPAAAQAAEVPVQPGTQTVTDDLQVTWSLTGGSEFALPATPSTPGPLPTASVFSPTMPTLVPGGTATPASTAMAVPTTAAMAGGTALPQPTINALQTGAPTPAIPTGAATSVTAAGTGTVAPAMGTPVTTMVPAAPPAPSGTPVPTATMVPAAPAAPSGTEVPTATMVPAAPPAPGTASATALPGLLATPSGAATPSATALPALMATPSGTGTAAPSATSLPGLLATPSGTATGAAGAARGATTEQGDIIIGLVQSVDTSTGAMRINGEQGPVTLATSPNTQLLGASGNTVGLPSFQADALVRADGQTDAAGRFIANRVQVIERPALLTVLGEVTGKSADGRIINIDSLTGAFNRLYLTSDATVTLPDGRNYSPAELVAGMNVEATGIRGTPGTLIAYHVSVLQR